MTFLWMVELEYILMAFKVHEGEVRKVCGKSTKMQQYSILLSKSPPMNQPQIFDRNFKACPLAAATAPRASSSAGKV